MNVKWEDVKADYARKDAEIETLKVMNAELVEALEGLLWGVDLETTDIPYTCISTANHALAKAKELNQ